MIQKTQFKLTDEEILVCAGFLGDDVLYGLEDKFFLNWDQKESFRMKWIVKILEEKFLLTCYPDGVVEMNGLLYELLTCMLSAEEILVLHETTEKRRRRCLYYYKNKDRICCMEREDGNTLYFLKPEERKFCLWMESLPINEKLTEALRKEIKELECSFDQEGAMQLLSNSLKQKEYGNLIRQIIKERYAGGTLMYYKWDGQRISDRCQLCYGMIQGRYFQIEKREDNHWILNGTMTEFERIRTIFFGGGMNGCSNCDCQR